MQTDFPGELPDFSDPDPLGVNWVDYFVEIEGTPPEEADRQDRLYSLIILGGGQGGSWTPADRELYMTHKEALWAGDQQWPFEDLPAGYDRFHNHLARLVRHYHPSQDGKIKFARAAGLIWGGIAYQTPVFKALAAASVGDHALQLHEGADGWKSRYVDDSNPAHHWVAAFLTGFIYGGIIGATVSAIRDIAQYITAQGGTMADIELGNLAAEHGAFLAGGDEGDVRIYDKLLDRMRSDLWAE